MARHLRQLTTALLTTTFIAGLALASTGPANAAAPTNAALLANTITQLNDTATNPCGDIVFLGLRGSGETAKDGTYGMGSPVTAIFNTFIGSVSGKRILATGVDYPALPVPVISSGPNRLNWLSTYVQGVDTGVDTTESKLIKRANDCPGEQFVLAGYSQGAMVVHRVVFDLAAPTAGPTAHDVLFRLDAVSTVGDGDRVPLDDVVTLGTSGTTAADYGVSFVNTSQSGVKHLATKSPMSSIGYGLNTRWFQVCDANDPVCDWGAFTGQPWLMAAGIREHIKGYTSANPWVVLAGQRMGRAVMDAFPAFTLSATVNPPSETGAPPSWYITITNVSNVTLTLKSLSSTGCGANQPTLPTAPLDPGQFTAATCPALTSDPPSPIFRTTLDATALGLDGMTYYATQDVVWDTSQHD